ncbi:SH3 domain-binding protein 5-like [Paramacrobiotus metropolitanus]|uniref:SH3 domain-binding protein 5-like n=1 Tax=Paramacrobiotus metropolitanus TaxID=2943436 RepID=UPI0024462BC6|nr:SH3 domain-binding protein 5-like [Paramacrobiotus metropolitanus]
MTDDKETANIKARLIQAKYEQISRKTLTRPIEQSNSKSSPNLVSSELAVSSSSAQFPRIHTIVEDSSEADVALTPASVSAVPSATKSLTKSVSSKKSTESRGAADEPVDPRIVEEITKLNDAATTTNTLQLQLQILEEKNAATMTVLNGDLRKLEQQLGRCVTEAAPYYEAKKELKQAEAALQTATFNYARARARFVFYKEQVAKLESDLIKQGGTMQLGPLSLLNALTANVTECQQDIRQKQREHADATEKQRVLTEKIKKLEKDYRHSIMDARPYYKLKDRMTYVNNDDRQRATQLRTSIAQAKNVYLSATEKLQNISKEIHSRRQNTPIPEDESVVENKLSEAYSMSSLAKKSDASVTNESHFVEKTFDNTPTHEL